MATNDARTVLVTGAGNGTGRAGQSKFGSI